MKFTLLLLFFCILMVFYSCKKDPNSLTVINSESFHHKQVELHFPVKQIAYNDSVSGFDITENRSQRMKELDELILLFQRVKQSEEDNLWAELKNKWDTFNTTYFGNYRTPYQDDHSSIDSISSILSFEAMNKWAKLNIDLLKLSGDVRFGDALEIMLYGTNGMYLTDSLLKSVIYTHVFDDIYINIFGSSSMEYQHTTGGTVKLIQNTNYPKGDEMILTFETSDIRFLDIYIRIPFWAKNPKVTYGNIKYVARPGEYCEVSKKWKIGDEIRVSLGN